MERALRVNTKELGRRAKTATYDTFTGGLFYIPLLGLDATIRGPLVHPSYVPYENLQKPLLEPNTPVFNFLSHAGNVPEGFLLGAAGFAFADLAMKGKPYSWERTLVASSLAFTAGTVLEMTWPHQTPDVNDIWALLPGIALFAGFRWLQTSSNMSFQHGKKDQPVFYFEDKPYAAKARRRPAFAFARG